jgi:magnesium transporter
VARSLIKGKARKQGLPPGTPVYVGEAKGGQPRITVFDYDETNVIEKQVENAEECFPFKDKPTVTWINVDGLHDTRLVHSLAEKFALHPLVHEDILQPDQRPKMEDLGEYLYIVLKMVRWGGQGDGTIIEQVSLILGPNFVISFQEQPGDVFDPIRDRIRSSKGRIRKMGADYLAYNLIDAIVDGYFVVLEHLGDRLEAIEDRVITHPTPETLKELYKLKREGLYFRRCVWPVRELIMGLERIETPLISESIGVYLRDAYDHTIQIIDTTETFRDMLSGLVETYLSSLSSRMNEVMKILTIIATIFIPLTFIVGVYGMNFKFMPELSWPWAYPAVLAIMLTVAVLMLLYFRRKRWL